MKVRSVVSASLAVAACACALLIVGIGVANAAQFSDIAAGGTSTCATKANGQLYCWGDGRTGQLGRIFANSARHPVQVIGTYDSVQVSAGTDYACQIHARGIFSCWGGNALGQLGDGRPDRAQYPQEVREPNGLTRVETGYATSCAIGAGGAVWCWGDDAVGQLGDGSAVMNSTTPKQVAGLSGAVDLAIGDKHVCALLGSGTLSCWGWTEYGRFVDQTAPIMPPVAAPGISDVVDVTAGTGHTCVLKRDGTVWCFGENDRGQTGQPADATNGTPTPAQVPGLSGISQIDAGGLSTCAVHGGDGTVFCWGDGHAGKLGNGGNTDSATPVQVANVSDVTKLSVGLNHVCVLTSKGAPFCWGSNRYGQIGNGDRTGIGVSVRSPTRVVDYNLGRATFIPRVLLSFPSGTSGGQIELRNLVLQKTSSRFSCPKSGVVTVSARGRSARRKAAITHRSKTSCRISGSFALPAKTNGATKASYRVSATHLRSERATLRAQRGS